jgi:hypothetical protein
MKSPAQAFLDEIDAFLKRTGMKASVFGRSALNDPNFVSDLRAGRMPNLGLVARVHEFIREHEANAA